MGPIGFTEKSESNCALRCVKSQKSADQHGKSLRNLLRTFSVCLIAMGKSCGKVWGCDSNSGVTYYSCVVIGTNVISCGLDVRPLHENRFPVNKSHSVSIALSNAGTSL
jgi:hypothetical protein